MIRGVIRGVIRRNQTQSDAIRRNQMQSDAIRWVIRGVIRGVILIKCPYLHAGILSWSPSLHTSPAFCLPPMRSS